MPINQSIKEIPMNDRLYYLKDFLEIPENISKFLIKNNFSDEQIDYLIKIIKSKNSSIDIVKFMTCKLSIEQMKLIKSLYDKGIKENIIEEFINNGYTEEKLQEELNKLPKKIYRFINKNTPLSERLSKAKIKAEELNQSK